MHSHSWITSEQILRCFYCCILQQLKSYPRSSIKVSLNSSAHVLSCRWSLRTNQPVAFPWQAWLSLLRDAWSVADLHPCCTRRCRAPDAAKSSGQPEVFQRRLVPRLVLDILVWVDSSRYCLNLYKVSEAGFVMRRKMAPRGTCSSRLLPPHPFSQTRPLMIDSLILCVSVIDHHQAL